MTLSGSSPRRRTSRPAGHPGAVSTAGWRRCALWTGEYAALAALLLSTLWLSARWLLPNGDVDEYHQYALAFWTQHPLLHALPAEYPPLAIAPFTLTLLPPAQDYHLVFALWMAALTLLGYAAFVRFAGRRRALIYILYLLLGAAATLLARFDIVPALVALAALWATERRRFTLAYALVAAGTLLKLYPAFLLPVVAIAHWQALSESQAAGEIATASPGEPAVETAPTGVPPRSLPARAGDRAGAADGSRRGDPSLVSSSVPSVSSAVKSLSASGSPLCPLRPLRPLRLVFSSPVAGGVTFCVLLVAAGFAGALALNPAGTLSVFRYAELRPLQIESTPASLMWLGSLAGIPALPNYSFVSLNLSGPLDAWLRPLSAVALLAGVCLVYWRQARGRLSVGRAFLGCLCIVLVTNKIFSPQYLIWVLPVVAAVEGFDPLWVAICLLTWLDFPMLYQTRHPILTVPYNPLFLPEVALRNGVLLWVTVRVIMRHDGSATSSRPQRDPIVRPDRVRVQAEDLPLPAIADTEAAPDG